MTIPLYPVFLQLSGRPVLLVGGGAVAARRIRDLQSCGARVTVISPDAHSDIATAAEAGAVEWIREVWDGNVPSHFALCIAATSDDAVNSQVVAAAAASDVIVVDAGEASRGDAIVPTVVRRGGVLVAISTSGSSPALAALIRTRIERCVGEEFALFADLLGDARVRVGRNGSQKARAELFRSVVTEDNLELVRSGRLDEVRERLAAEIERRGLGEPNDADRQT